MPDLPTPEELDVEGWAAFQRGGVRAIPGGFDNASPEELRARSWDVDRGPIFEIDYTGRRKDAVESEAAVKAELDRQMERRKAEV